MDAGGPASSVAERWGPDGPDASLSFSLATARVIASCELPLGRFVDGLVASINSLTFDSLPQAS